MTNPLVTLSYEQLKTDLEEIAAQDPDYEYPMQADGTCMYFTPDGAPSCIIGHVLFRHGVTLANLNDISVAEPSTFATKPANANISSITTLGKAGLVAFTELKARDLASSAQAHQDMGENWADSVSLAIQTVSEDYRPYDETEHETEFEDA